MANPFERHANPTTAAQHQANANYWTYERMAAQDEINEFDRLKISAPRDVISALHTAKWVEKEHSRIARAAHAAAMASSFA